MMRYLILAVVLSCCLGSSAAEQAEPPQVSQAMNNERLQALIEGLARDVEGQPGYWRFTLHDFAASVITDEKADRMRIIVPVAEVKNLDEALLLRLMQANFDSALDARYSIAKGILWSAFIHPLSDLSDHQFIDGLAQTVNLAATFGTTYSSGALVFGGGDSQGEQNKYYRAIIERKDSI
jgi:hypothetical protein